VVDLAAAVETVTVADLEADSEAAVETVAAEEEEINLNLSLIVRYMTAPLWSRFF
jgi:hypothetical protein